MKRRFSAVISREAAPLPAGFLGGAMRARIKGFYLDGVQRVAHNHARGSWGGKQSFTKNAEEAFRTGQEAMRLQGKRRDFRENSHPGPSQGDTAQCPFSGKRQEPGRHT